MALYQDKCIRKHGVTDEGRGVFADILTAAAIASAAYNSTRAVQIATDEWNMAKKYWKISKNWFNYYQDSFAPVEDQEVDEAMNLEEEIPDYEISRGRSRVIAWLQYKGVVGKTIRCTSKYCTGLRMDIISDLASSQANAVALADGLGYRNERAYIESRNDIRFEKMLNTSKRGRNMISDNVSLAKNTSGIYGNAWNQAWEGLAGSGYFLGYQASRNPTAYPLTFVEGRENLYNNSMNNNSAQQNIIAQSISISKEVARYGE